MRFLLYLPSIFLNFATHFDSFLSQSVIKRRIMRAIHTTLTLLFASIVLLPSCQKSLEEKAAQDAKEYTRKYCPTPFINNTRTDSVTFNTGTRVYTYYCTFTDALDNQEIIDLNRKKLTEILAASVKESTQMKPYIQAGFHFQYICRSASNPDLILLQARF